MGARRPPYVFTELGVAMLSSVLNSAHAVQMNIVIMRTFVRMREVMASQKELSLKVDRIGEHVRQQGNAIALLADEIHHLKTTKEKPARRIGFLAAPSQRTL